MNSEPMVYLHGGLRVRSELELQLPQAGRTAGEVDVEVRMGVDIVDSDSVPPGVVIAEEWQGDWRLFTAVRDQAGYVVRFSGVGEFVISNDLRAVEVRADRSGAHRHLLPVLMAGAVATIVHELRGATILHASAVAIDGRAMAFIGRSGQGKSTIAAWLCRSGASLVTDDILLVDPGPPVGCMGAAAALRLRPAATSLAEQMPGFAARPTVDDRIALEPVDVVIERLPLAAIVIASPSRDATQLKVIEAPEMAQLMALLASPRINGWKLEDVLSRRFDTVAKMVGVTSVFAAEVPWGPPFDPEVAGGLLDLIRVK